MQDSAFGLQEALLEAGLGAHPERLRSLERADLALAQTRLYARLAHDMGWFSLGQYEHVARMLDEIGRLLGGWQRKEREKQ